MCKYSKLTRLIPVFAGVGELAAPEVAKLFFENVVCLFGVPAMVLHDRDPWFTASFLVVALDTAWVVQCSAWHSIPKPMDRQNDRIVLSNRCCVHCSTRVWMTG